ncbi:MAG TPA: PspA/IM30 family protein [Polyangia bacterium]|jgi:phage shock protein A|nr:PspA/IM30 family protein [Polyangia bacterium]
MGIFSRMSNLFRSKANAAIDQMSDPAKEVEQIIIEMEDQLRQARAETVKCKATEKLCAQRVTDLERRVASWNERAEAAVQHGDDTLAREALSQRMLAEEELAGGRRELAEARAYASKLAEMLPELERRLATYRLRKGTIKAKATMAKRDLQPGSTDAFDEFNRMAGKVDDAETEVEAHRELADDRQRDAELSASIERAARLPAAAASDPIAERLAALKEKMGKKEP